jgi:hypothetical protein
VAKADRLERLDFRRIELEAEYLEVLVAALQKTAAGTWGLFGHKQDRASRANAEATVQRLCEIGDEVDGMREQLMMEQFLLHHEFLAARGPVPSHAVGEPKQAAEWLERLGMPLAAKGR